MRMCPILQPLHSSMHFPHGCRLGLLYGSVIRPCPGKHYQGPMISENALRWCHRMLGYLMLLSGFMQKVSHPLFMLA